MVYLITIVTVTNKIQKEYQIEDSRWILFGSAYDSLEDFRYTAPLVNRLQYEPEAYSKCWEGSERGMLYYRLKELEGYFNGTGELKDFRELKERLAEAVKEEPPVSVE